MILSLISRMFGARYKILRYTSLILILLLLISCGNDEDIGLDTKASFEAIIDGEEVYLVESDSLIYPGTYIKSTSSLMISTGYYYDSVYKEIYVFGLDLGHLIMGDDTAANKISINFISHLSDYDLDENEKISHALFKEILSVGNKTFSGNYKTEPGISVEWYDSKGVKWTSGELFLSGELTPVTPDFSGSSFKIRKSESVDPVYGFYKYSQYLEISFNCNLYNVNGDSISMNDADFIGTYSISDHY
jgi:hypothetical protein